MLRIRDQDTTDLGKCIRQAKIIAQEKGFTRTTAKESDGESKEKEHVLLIYGAFGGRYYSNISLYF